MFQNYNLKGLTRESNSEPLAPKARIIPLDQRAKVPRPGIEPEAIAWKATMLPLHQRGFVFCIFSSS